MCNWFLSFKLAFETNCCLDLDILLILFPFFFLFFHLVSLKCWEKNRVLQENHKDFDQELKSGSIGKEKKLLKVTWDWIWDGNKFKSRLKLETQSFATFFSGRFYFFFLIDCGGLGLLICSKNWIIGWYEALWWIRRPTRWWQWRRSLMLLITTWTQNVPWERSSFFVIWITKM